MILVDLWGREGEWEGQLENLRSQRREANEDKMNILIGDIVFGNGKYGDNICQYVMHNIWTHNHLIYYLS